MNEGDNAIFLPDSSGKLIAVKVYSAGVGQDALLLPDSGGKRIAVKVAIPTVGETGFSIPDSSGKLIMVKFDGIMPNPPAPDEWTNIFPYGGSFGSLIANTQYIFAGAYYPSDSYLAYADKDAYISTIGAGFAYIDFLMIFNSKMWHIGYATGDAVYSSAFAANLPTGFGIDDDRYHDNGQAKIAEHNGKIWFPRFHEFWNPPTNPYGIRLLYTTGNGVWDLFYPNIEHYGVPAGNGTIDARWCDPASIAAHGGSVYMSIDMFGNIPPDDIRNGIWISSGALTDWTLDSTLGDWAPRLMVCNNGDFYAGAFWALAPPYKGVLYKRGGGGWVSVLDGSTTTPEFSYPWTITEVEGFLFLGTLDGHIFMSENGGGTWSHYKTFAGGTAVMALLGWNKRLYAACAYGTEPGFWRSPEIK